MAALVGVPGLASGRARVVVPSCRWGLTLVFCCLAWVAFRSPAFDTTLLILRGLLPDSGGTIEWRHTPPTLLILSAAIVWHAVYQFAPSIMARVPFRRR